MLSVGTINFKSTNSRLQTIQLILNSRHEILNRQCGVVMICITVSRCNFPSNARNEPLRAVASQIELRSERDI